MREDFRVDLRDGPAMREVRESLILNGGESERDALDELGYRCLDGGSGGAMPTIIDAKNKDGSCSSSSNKKKHHSLRFNPFVLEIIRKLQNPSSSQPL
eukprot:CAMPEP_0197256036 /NCGR_PEP_ID=MMETSP1429-20130617/73979_1 /TAXON_ID=49237 /ORGANISM="Chaetoceros  sp., Strain UNC1202" /LENGTH=97 /DNA_ID=CAMNT_0042719485 /DNA_START=180 /DNA_END=469 /DNA_ORIENTATION=+